MVRLVLVIGLCRIMTDIGSNCDDGGPLCQK